MSSRKNNPAYRVYVIELGREVLTKARFVRANPDRRDAKPCVYVGSTALSPEERFERHLSGRKANPYVRQFGVRLRPRLYEKISSFDQREAAETAEAKLAERLRRKGYAVWSN